MSVDYFWFVARIGDNSVDRLEPHWNAVMEAPLWKEPQRRAVRVSRSEAPACVDPETLNDIIRGSIPKTLRLWFEQLLSKDSPLAIDMDESNTEFEILNGATATALHWLCLGPELKRLPHWFPNLLIRSTEVAALLSKIEAIFLRAEYEQRMEKWLRLAGNEIDPTEKARTLVAMLPQGLAKAKRGGLGLISFCHYPKTIWEDDKLNPDPAFMRRIESGAAAREVQERVHRRRKPVIH